MPPAFVLDEHFRGPLWQAVLRENLVGDYPLDVACVGDVPELPLGIDDRAILRWSEATARLVVTEDRRTMVGHLQSHLAAGGHSPGILMVRSGMRLRELLECLILIGYAGDPTEFVDAVTFIP